MQYLILNQLFHLKFSQDNLMKDLVLLFISYTWETLYLGII